MLNFNQLRAFYQAAKSLSFTVAARKLYVTQPAVTSQIKLFEGAINMKLFKRKGHRMYLTEEGTAIFRHASKVFALEKDLELLITDLHKMRQGNLRIGTTKTYAKVLMPTVLASFHNSNPNTTIDLDEGSSHEMINSLLDLRNSLIIVAKMGDNPEINFMPLLREEVIFILSPQHHLAQKKAISFNDIINEQIIMKEIGSGTRNLIDEHYKSIKKEPKKIAQASNMEFIKELVKQGQGVSFVVHSAVKKELKDSELIAKELAGEKLFLDICVAHLKDYELPIAAKVFLEFLGKLSEAKEPKIGIDFILDALTKK